jgi:hypothetical protein
MQQSMVLQPDAASPNNIIVHGPWYSITSWTAQEVNARVMRIDYTPL